MTPSDLKSIEGKPSVVVPLPVALMKFPSKRERYAKKVLAHAQMTHQDVRVVRSGDHALLRLGPLVKELNTSELGSLIDRLIAILDDIEDERFIASEGA